MKNIFRAAAITMAIAAVAIQSPASAGSASANFGPTMQVPGTCTISKAGDLSFGSYNGTPATASGALQYQCTNGMTNVWIGFDQGSNCGTHGVGCTANSGQHVVWNNGVPTDHAYQYVIYQDGSYSVPWGNSQATGFAASADGLTHIVSVYAQIGTNSNVMAGSYTDNTTATINF